jgi:hypothetical protein
MTTKSMFAITAAVILGAASPAPGKDGSLPKIDIERTCRENTVALGGLMGANMNDSMTVCLDDEKAAQDQLVKDWATYPPLARQRCVQPDEYLPGYVEWLVCIEMTRDVIKMRKERSQATTVGSGAGRQKGDSRGSTKSQDCPIVKIGEDGSVAWVITNC